MQPSRRNDLTAPGTMASCSLRRLQKPASDNKPNQRGPVQQAGNEGVGSGEQLARGPSNTAPAHNQHRRDGRPGTQSLERPTSDGPAGEPKWSRHHLQRLAAQP
jgi:hypothetical protein